MASVSNHVVNGQGATTSSFDKLTMRSVESLPMTDASTDILLTPAQMAEADGKAPLPFPLEVEGDKVEGSGTLLFQSILPMERIDLPPTTQPSATQPGAGGASAATTGPTSGPAVSATLADEPPTPKVTFDPATFNGNLADLTPDQRNQVFQYRRDQQIKTRQQRRQPPQQQSGQRK